MRIPTPKLHNKILSNFKSAPADSPRATPRLPAGTAQEAVGPSPGPDLSPDARGPKPRKNPRGPASPDALLPAPDACGNLPQKKTRTPVPARQERSRRGRPYPQNRDGSGNAGKAEGSLPRLASEGRDIEQEIILLRSMINRLLSRRPLNYPYLFRCLNLIVKCTTVKARYFKNESEDKIDDLAAGMRRLFESTMADRTIGYRNLLPILMAKPGEDWTHYYDLLPIHPDLLDSLLEVKEAWEREQGSPFIDNPSDDEEPPPFGMRPLPPHLYQPPDDDPPPDPSVIPDPACPREIGGESIPRGGAARAEALEVRAGKSPHPTHLPPYDEDPAPEPGSIAQGGMGGPTPSPSTGEGWGEGDLLPGVESAHPEQGRRVERILGGAVTSHFPTPSPVGATGGLPGWADPNLPTNSKSPRIARGRPPP